MKKGRFFLSLSLSIVIFTGLALLYLNKVYLPGTLKPYLADGIEKASGRRVAIGKISYNPFTGITINNLAVYEKDPSKDEIFIKIDSAVFNINIIPLIKRRVFVLTSLRVDKPFVSFKRDPAGKWNFEDIAIPANKSKNTGGDNRLIIKSAAITKGRVHISDSLNVLQFSKDIQGLDCRMDMGIDGRIRFALFLFIKNSSEKEPSGGTAGLKGSYDLGKKELEARLSLYRIPLGEYRPYYKDSNRDILCGIIESESDILLAGEKLDIRSKTYLKDLRFTLFNVEADGAIDISSHVASDLKNKDSLDYSARLTLKDFKVEGLDIIKKVSGLNGDIVVEKDTVKTEGLKGMSLECPIGFEARMEDFSDPYVSVNMRMDSENDKLTDFAPTGFKLMAKDLKLTGSSSIEVTIDGKLKDGLRLSGYAEIRDAGIKNNKLGKEVSALSGKISFDSDSVKTDNLGFDYDKKTYALKAEYKDYKNPVLDIGLKSDILDANAEFNLLAHDIKVSYAKGTYRNSSFDIHGDMHGYANSSFDLTGTLSVRPDDLVYLYPTLSKSFDNLKPEGIVVTEAAYIGDPKDILTWDIMGKAHSDKLSIKGFAISNMRSDIYMKNGVLDIEMTADGYDGDIALILKSDLKKEPAIYALQASINNVSIQKLKNDTGFRENDISGKLNFSAIAGGDYGDIGSLEGYGSVAITDGKLFDLPIMAGLSNALNVPNLRKVTFTRGGGTFKIQNSKVSTHDLTMDSEQVGLGWDGDLSFNGDVDFLIVVSIAKENINYSDPLAKFAGFILGGVSNFINIRLKGTLDKPKYTPVVNPNGILQNKIFEKFRGIFEGTRK